MPSSILNSDDGVISGTSGLKSSGGDDGVLNIQNNGTTAVTVAADGDVGVGTTSPTSGVKLDVVSADSSQQYADVLRLKTSNTGDIHPAILFENNRGSVANAFKIALDSSNGVAGSSVFFIRMKDSGGTFNNQVAVQNDGRFQFNSGYGSVATAYGCRAWVNFNGTGTVAIREDGNVSSVTDRGTGEYTLNLTTALPDANYCGVASATIGGSNNTNRDAAIGPVNTSSAYCNSWTSDSGASTDVDVICAAIFR